MKIISAIVRTTCVENIAKALEDIDIKGMTFYEIKGIGEQAVIFNPYTIHYKIEIILTLEEP
ncbi:MAG: P-II family nitrogen regulator [Nitrospirota bacterium]